MAAVGAGGDVTAPAPAPTDDAAPSAGSSTVVRATPTHPAVAAACAHPLWSVDAWGSGLYALLREQIDFKGTKEGFDNEATLASYFAKVRHGGAEAARAVGHSDPDDQALVAAAAVAAAIVWRNPGVGEGWTPLHLSVVYDIQPGSSVVCFLLSCLPEAPAVDAGAVPSPIAAVEVDLDEVRDNAQQTPLHKACQRTRWDPTVAAVKALLARGAHAVGDGVKDKDGKTPLDYAEHPDCASIRAAIATHERRPFSRVTVPHAFPWSDDVARTAALKAVPLTVEIEAARSTEGWGEDLFTATRAFDELEAGRRRTPLESVQAAVARIQSAAASKHTAAGTGAAAAAAARAGHAAVAAAVTWRGQASGGSTALHLASAKDVTIGAPVLTYLLSLLPEGTSIDDIKDSKGRTPLHYCVRNMKDVTATAATALLARGASAVGEHVTDVDSNATPHDWAAGVKLSKFGGKAGLPVTHVLQAMEIHAETPYEREDVPQAFPWPSDEARAEAMAAAPLTDDIAAAEGAEPWGQRLWDPLWSDTGNNEYGRNMPTQELLDETMKTLVALRESVQARLEADGGDTSVDAVRRRAMATARNAVLWYNDSAAETFLHAVVRLDTLPDLPLLAYVLSLIPDDGAGDAIDAAKDGMGRTPQHLAVIHCRAHGGCGALLMLLARGASAAEEDSNGENVLELAEGHYAGTGAAELIRQHEDDDLGPFDVDSPEVPIACFPEEMRAEKRFPGESMLALWALKTDFGQDGNGDDNGSGDGGASGTDGDTGAAAAVLPQRRVVRSLSQIVAKTVYQMVAVPRHNARLVPEPFAFAQARVTNGGDGGGGGDDRGSQRQGPPAAAAAAPDAAAAGHQPPAARSGGSFAEPVRPTGSGSGRGARARHRATGVR